jgi:hypothetical protein
MQAVLVHLDRLTLKPLLLGLVPGLQPWLALLILRGVFVHFGVRHYVLHWWTCPDPDMTLPLSAIAVRSKSLTLAIRSNPDFAPHAATANVRVNTSALPATLVLAVDRLVRWWRVKRNFYDLSATHIVLFLSYL